MRISELMEILEFAKEKYGDLPVKAYDDTWDEDPLIAYVPKTTKRVLYPPEKCETEPYIEVNARGNFHEAKAIIIKHSKNK